MDSLNPINGADVRMLRMLAMEATAESAGSGVDLAAPTERVASTSGFLDQWLADEGREERLWRAFSAAADVHINTALAYDMHVLKVMGGVIARTWGERSRFA